MYEQSSQHSRYGKRKRRTSEPSQSNDENLPWNEEKKRKDGDEDVFYGNEENLTANLATDSDCERLPLSELSLFECQNGTDNQDLSMIELISEQERLSISEYDSSPANISETDIQNSSREQLTDDEESDFQSTAEVFDNEDEDEVSKVNSILDFDKPSTSKQYVEPCSEDFGQLTPTSIQTTPSAKKHKTQEKKLPFPELRWANSEELWDRMLIKDEDSVTTRDADLFTQHPSLQPRMRAVLLDWIIEVCEVYKLHRETYYLTMDYVDRYLTAISGISKQQLQLIGITCLLIASKVEEIYPPKVSEYAYVTDGACTEDEILSMELIILKSLGWQLSPVTVNSWLSVYLQLCYTDKARHSLGFIFPQFAETLFKRISQLLDLSTLDYNSLKYSYRVLAASCLYLACSKTLALRVTGFKEDELKYCIEWMSSFWEVLQESFPEQRRCKSLPPGMNKTKVTNDDHNLLVHSVSLEMLEAGQSKLECLFEKDNTNLNILTPPSSSKKQTTGTYT